MTLDAPGARPSPSGGARQGSAVVLDGTTVTYGRGRDRREALARVDLDFPPGELVTILGPSGCGKSTLLGLVAGFLHPSTGEVRVDGKPVHGPGADRGVVFQQPRLFPWLSVRRNVEFGPRMARVPAPERRQLAADALTLVGLSDVADRAPHELSGGMQQRAAIARALGGRPSVLLMDEPFAALDALTRERLQDELLRVWAATGMTVLFVTHSVEEAAYLGSRVVVLSARPGRVIADRVLPRTLSSTAGSTTTPRDDTTLVAEREVLRRLVHEAAG